ncbi:MAG: type IV pilin N-terminal domain-containing protein [Euryarchaeota archaeon]|nr:type IV pilin N-terminal domain-containing protein [Euryarchaeota archaeon]
MKANRKFIDREEAVSPVIAVILMVAITVVLAAGVFVLVNQFGASSSNIVQASVNARAYDSSGNGATDAIEFLLTDAPSAPFAPGIVKVQRNGTTLDGSTIALNNFTAQNVSIMVNGTALAQGVSKYIFTTVTQVGPGAEAPAVQTWRNGEKLYIDCAPGPNRITVIISNNGVVDKTINCDE